MAYIKINSLEELKKITDDVTVDVFIWLGCARSSKQISWDSSIDRWFIYNEIDDTEIECSTAELATETNILEALEKGRLYKH